MFKQNFIKLCNESNVPPTTVCQSVGLSKSAFSYWTADSVPREATLQKIADYFNVSVEYLTRESEEDSYELDPTWIKVLGRVAAGIPIEAIEEVIGWEQIPEEMARSGEFIGLQIHGTSMEPRMKEGDVIIVRLQDDCDSGDTAVVMINGDEATCKVVQKSPEGITLISTNPVYEPRFFTNRQIEEEPVRILGKVVELRAKY